MRPPVIFLLLSDYVFERFSNVRLTLKSTEREWMYTALLAPGALPEFRARAMSRPGYYSTLVEVKH